MALVNKKKEALGKGLRALLSDMDEETEILKISDKDQDSIINTVPKINLEYIEVNPYQPRKDFNEEALQELANSIQVHGVIQPITVRKIDDKKYQLIAGERRFRASKIAGLTDIPAYVRTTNDQELVEIALIENIQREDLNAMEIALTYQRLIDEIQLTHENLADRLGKDRSTVTNYLRLLKLPPEIQKSLRDKSISMGHARSIISIPEIDKQLYILKEVLKNELSVRKTEELVRTIGQKSDKKTTATPTTQSLPNAYKQVEQRLMDKLETKIKIKKGKGEKGEITIPFYSTSDLNRLLEIIEGE
ncbi:MAG: ParB/RepB/Spo0J family partition protein [Sphingobacteriales bacterium]|jgi:ParB family chromosome partitioning protein|nr:MAG: ParB/RepB/Spo0J family partition protein [Sphingobacteriales bacterium]